MAENPTPKEAPSIGLPPSQNTCLVSMIDSTCDIVTTWDSLVEPYIEGHQYLNLPTWTFHITNQKSGEQVIFDLGCKKDWQNSVPHIADLAANHVPGLRVKNHVADILTDGGVKLKDLKALILSHWHFDHCGDLTTLPQSVDLLVGPGFKEEFLPGYPTKESSPFWEKEFEGRNVIEVPFDDKLKLGKFQAHDYFGDGSLYILNVPGHATGHISALVRTTPDTAVFLGGDVCHLTSMVRPSEYIPLPGEIPSETALDQHFTLPCPCSVFTACHPNQEKSRTTPFYKPSTASISFYMNPPLAIKSIGNLAEFDADPNVLVLIAHDVAPRDVMTLFPNGHINDWQQKGWKKQMHWNFLNELPINGKAMRKPLLDGLYNDAGKHIKTLKGEPVN